MPTAFWRNAEPPCAARLPPAFPSRIARVRLPALHCSSATSRRARAGSGARFAPGARESLESPRRAAGSLGGAILYHAFVGARTLRRRHEIDRADAGPCDRSRAARDGAAGGQLVVAAHLDRPVRRQRPVLRRLRRRARLARPRRSSGPRSRSPASTPTARSTCTSARGPARPSSRPAPPAVTAPTRRATAGVTTAGNKAYFATNERLTSDDTDSVPRRLRALRRRHDAHFQGAERRQRPARRLFRGVLRGRDHGPGSRRRRASAQRTRTPSATSTSDSPATRRSSPPGRVAATAANSPSGSARPRMGRRSSCTPTSRWWRPTPTRSRTSTSARVGPPRWSRPAPPPPSTRTRVRRSGS